MTNYETKIYNELERRLQENNYKEISITMKCNGDTVTITPCARMGDVTSLSDAEYFLVISPSIPWLGGDTLEDVAKQIANYENTIADNNDEKEKCRKFFKENIIPYHLYLQ